MNVLLDTTYLMPAIGVSISGVKPSILRILREKGHSTFISELTLFELSAKGAKHVASHELEPERVRRGIMAVAHDEALIKIPLLEGEVIQMSFNLRGVMNDYLDCVILSSAISSCEALVTEDRLIHGVEDNPLYKHIIEQTNPSFKILSSSEIHQLTS
jgi:predicted nucleic acid-binding protein